MLCDIIIVSEVMQFQTKVVRLNKSDNKKKDHRFNPISVVDALFEASGHMCDPTFDKFIAGTLTYDYYNQQQPLEVKRQK